MPDIPLATRGEFEAASDWLANTPAAASLSNDIKLELYGLFKYITTSSGPTTSRPSIFSPTQRAKYDAHQAQTSLYNAQSEGIPKARTRYVQIAKSIGWSGEGLGEEEDGDGEIDLDKEDGGPELGGKKRGGGGMGVKVSMMSLEFEEGDNHAGPSTHPIHEGVLSNSPDAIREIISADPSQLDIRDGNGNTPLHLAVDRGYAEVVQLLLDKGADRQAKDEDGQTPLEIAELLDRRDILVMLRKAG